MQAPLPRNSRKNLEIADNLARIDFDKSTVFRVLQDFISTGLARRLDVGDHAWRYEQTSSIPTGTKGHAHPHMLCVDCGSVTCLADAADDLRVPKSVGDIEEIILKGHCKPCQEANR
ncbi:MAG: hypothetical protein FJ309_08235 [Planctomycetes bacterium]|nr:hypothetical protein [Planctomycetota bacterium]